MPKIVDHAQRRIEIADALYRVIARAGIDAASVRAVAAEAGWSMGAVRHYFATQDELLQFGVQLQIERIPERIREVVGATKPGLRRAQLILETLIALDDERLAEARVWLAAMTRARVDARFDEARAQGWTGEQYICRGVVRDLLGQPWPDAMDTRLSARHESEATRLHVFVDGLTLIGTTYAEQLDRQSMREMVGRELRELQRRLT